MMGRRFLQNGGICGILILFCLSLNLLAAWHVPPISSGIFIPHGATERPPIPETALWNELLQRHDECDNTNGTIVGTTTTSFSQQVRRFVDNKQTNGCFVPRSSSCHIKTLSVVVLSDGKNLRTLFLNLLPFISYSPVDDVTLIANIDQKTLARDPKYGRRILDWHRTGTIKFIPVQSSFWTPMQKVEPNSGAVVWFNGDSPKNWNVAGLKTSLALWRENSRSLVASHVVQADQGCEVPLLHDLMMSRDYLCYLKHPLIDSFRRMAEKQDSTSIHDSVAVLWSFLAEGSIKIPAHRQNQTIPRAQSVPDNMLKYFGCSCPAQNAASPTHNEAKLTCSTRR
jgi:hypothetical protein